MPALAWGVALAQLGRTKIREQQSVNVTRTDDPNTLAACSGALRCHTQVPSRPGERVGVSMWPLQASPVLSYGCSALACAGKGFRLQACGHACVVQGSSPVPWCGVETVDRDGLLHAQQRRCKGTECFGASRGFRLGHG